MQHNSANFPHTFDISRCIARTRKGSSILTPTKHLTSHVTEEQSETKKTMTGTYICIYIYICARARVCVCVYRGSLVKHRIQADVYAFVQKPPSWNLDPLLTMLYLLYRPPPPLPTKIHINAHTQSLSLSSLQMYSESIS
jgi:hypothetical protein